MPKLTDSLTTMLTPAVQAAGYNMVGVEFVRAGKHSILRVYIDHENGISVDDCADASYQISAVLDLEDPISTEYHLEVSSPGLDRPLFSLQHYVQCVGQLVSIKLSRPVEGNRRNYQGRLLSVEQEQQQVVVEVDGEHHTLPFLLVDKANVIPEF